MEGLPVQVHERILGDDGTSVLIGNVAVGECMNSGVEYFWTYAPKTACGTDAHMKFEFRGPHANGLSVLGGNEFVVQSDTIHTLWLTYCPTIVDTPFSDPSATGLTDIDTMYSIVSYPPTVFDTLRSYVYTRTNHPNVISEVTPEFNELTAFPNPFRLAVHISINEGLAQSISIVDCLGRNVANPQPSKILESQREYSWKANPNLPAGIYIIRIKTARGLQNRVVTLVK
jgi:hypothetical protein